MGAETTLAGVPQENGISSLQREKPAGPPQGPGQPAPRPPYSALYPAKRRLILSIVTVAGFFGPLAAGIYLPALPVLQRSFHTSATVINATVSVFMGVLAVAPLFWASQADYAGRKPLYIISLLIYIAANILLAALPANLAALFILRIVQGFGAASVLSLGAGTVADIIEPKKRASAMSMVLLGPQLGPVLGPLLGGALTGGANWRWTFWFLVITCSATLILLLFGLPETLRSIVGNGAIYADSRLLTRPIWRQKPVVDPAKFPRPPPPTLLGLLKLMRHPPILIVYLNNSILFAAYYAITVTYSRLLADNYGFSVTEVGVAYLAPGIALVLGSMISGRISDYHLRTYNKLHPDNPAHPERRLHLQIPGIVVSLSGVLMFGWLAHFHIHVSSVIISSSIAAFGMTWVFITTTAYLTESTKNTPATLVALAGLFRNPAAAVAAAVVEPLIGKMGIGWCFNGLALVELACVASSLWLLLRGKEMRRKLEERQVAAGGSPGSGPGGRPGPLGGPLGGPPPGKPPGGEKAGSIGAL